MKAAKNVLIWACLSVIIISSSINTIRQMTGLRRAIRDNLASKAQLYKLEREQKNLRERIKEATESAYIEGQKRELLGMGTENDYWIIMPPEENLEEVYPTVNNATKKSNFAKWIEMFTD